MSIDGNVFYAEVKYDINPQAVTLVQDHWWAFNGKSACKNVGERWRNETGWVVTIFTICVLASSVITHLDIPQMKSIMSQILTI